MVPEILSILYGCFKAGMTVVPIFAGFGTGAIATRLEDSGARVLFTADYLERRGKRLPLLEKMPAGVEHTVVLRYRGSDAAGGIAWHDFLGGDQPARPTEPAERAFILYTSGTTGKPKGVVHTHAGCLAQMGKEIWLGFDHQPDDRFFWLSDIGWMMGPWTILGNHLFGGTIFLYDGAPDYPGPMRLWEMIERHRITTFGISPTAIRMLSKQAGDLPPMDVAAPAGLDRRALGRSLVALVLRARRPPPLPHHQYFGRHRDRRQLPVSAADPDAEALHAGRSGARDGHRSGGRKRHAGARQDGLSGVHRARAFHDARHLERSAALHRHLLVAISRHGGITAIGPAWMKTATGSCTAAPTNP